MLRGDEKINCLPHCLTYKVRNGDTILLISYLLPFFSLREWYKRARAHPCLLRISQGCRYEPYKVFYGVPMGFSFHIGTKCANAIWCVLKHSMFLSPACEIRVLPWTGGSSLTAMNREPRNVPDTGRANPMHAACHHLLTVPLTADTCKCDFKHLESACPMASYRSKSFVLVSVNLCFNSFLKCTETHIFESLIGMILKINETTQLIKWVRGIVRTSGSLNPFF